MDCHGSADGILGARSEWQWQDRRRFGAVRQPHTTPVPSGVWLPNSSEPSSILPLPFRSSAKNAIGAPVAVHAMRFGVPSASISNMTGSLLPDNWDPPLPRLMTIGELQFEYEGQLLPSLTFSIPPGGGCGGGELQFALTLLSRSMYTSVVWPYVEETSPVQPLN